MLLSHDDRKDAIYRVLEAIEALKKGDMIILTDDELRENEGDLVFAAQDVTPEKINFLAKEARGLICLALDKEHVSKLKLPMMNDHSKNITPMGTAFTVSIEAKTGVTTGISAKDRARTIQVAKDEKTTPEDIVVPGHIFPLLARNGGVLERVGHTEGSVDLVRLAGKKKGAVICEVMNNDGSMARLDDLKVFSKKHEIPLVSIRDLIIYRLLNDTFIEEIKREPFQTPLGTFTGAWFKNQLDQTIHLALIKGSDFSETITHVRVQRQHPFFDVLGGVAEDHKPGRWSIDHSLEMLAKSSHGVFIYLPSPAQGVDDEFMINADYLSMDPRLYGVGAQILKMLGVVRMNLHVTSERFLIGLSGFGLEVVETTIIQP